MNNEKHYLFDFDGTLVDSMEVWAGTHIENLKKSNIEVPSDFVETITPLGNYNASKFAISLGLDISLEEYLEELSQSLIKAYATRVPLKDNVADTLKRLKKQNIHLHVLTASPHTYVDDCLKKWQVYDLFEKVWSIDDFGLTKGETLIYEKAAQRLNADIKNCTMVDDNYTAIATAKAAGMNTIAIFDKSSASSETALREIADKYIYNFNEI